MEFRRVLFRSVRLPAQLGAQLRADIVVLREQRRQVVVLVQHRKIKGGAEPLAEGRLPTRRQSRHDHEPPHHMSTLRMVAAAPAELGYLRLRRNKRRPEARRVGKACVSTCRTRWSADHEKKNKQ